MAVQVRREHYEHAIRCGARLTLFRKARKLTLKQVAERSGFSPQQIFLVEKGEINTPIETLARIAEALGLSLEAVLSSPAEKEGQYARCVELARAVLELAPA